MVLENATPRGQEMIQDGIYNWDSHAVNGHIFKDTRHKLGFLDTLAWVLCRQGSPVPAGPLLHAALFLAREPVEEIREHTTSCASSAAGS